MGEFRGGRRPKMSTRARAHGATARQPALRYRWQGGCCDPAPGRGGGRFSFCRMAAVWGGWRWGWGSGQSPERMTGRSIVSGTVSAKTRDTPMVLSEFLPFLGMCTLAAGVYSLASWLGYWF